MFLISHIVNKITRDKKAVANGFIYFFINAGANVAKGFPSDNKPRKAWKLFPLSSTLICRRL